MAECRRCGEEAGSFSSLCASCKYEEKEHKRQEQRSGSGRCPSCGYEPRPVGSGVSSCGCDDNPYFDD